MYKVSSPTQFKKSTYLRAANSPRLVYVEGFRYLRDTLGVYRHCDESRADRLRRMALWEQFCEWFGFDATERIFQSWEWSKR